MVFTPAVSKTNTPLFDTITSVSESVFGAPVVPTVSTGFTDSHFFEIWGLQAMATLPLHLGLTNLRASMVMMKGICENIVEGIKTFYRVLEEFTVD